MSNSLTDSATSLKGECQRRLGRSLVEENIIFHDVAIKKGMKVSPTEGVIW